MTLIVGFHCTCDLISLVLYQGPYLSIQVDLLKAAFDGGSDHLGLLDGGGRGLLGGGQKHQGKYTKWVSHKIVKWRSLPLWIPRVITFKTILRDDFAAQLGHLIYTITNIPS